MEDGVSLSMRDITIEKTAEGDLRLLLDVAREAANAPDTDALLRDLLGAICDANHWDYCEAWLGEDVEGARPERRALWHSGSDERLIPFSNAIDDMKHFADGDLPTLAWIKRSVVVARSASDLSAAPVRRKAAIAARLSAAVAVPVFAGQQLVAVLSFYARDKRTIDDRRLELLGAVASEVGAIIAHKLSEQALANERAFLSAVLDSLSENVSVCDAEGRLTLFNRATRDTHGLPEDPALPPEEWAKHYAVFASDGVTPFRADQMPHVRVRETGQDVEGIEFVVAVPGRAPRTMVANARVMRGQNGEIVGSVCAARDVTSRRQAQRALLESERRFRQVLENVRSLAVTLDTNGNITFVNEALLQSTGWTRGEVDGKSWFDLFVPKEGGLPQRFYDSVARNEIPAHVENDILTRAGERRLIAWDTTALRDASGTLVGTASIGRDVTEQRALEARLAALSEHDELTGLANRRGFRRMAEQELKSGRRAGRRGAVLYIDVNDLKPINDTHGHAGGDDALRTVARTLRDSVRDADLVARLGGDEFALFATGVATLAEADILVARLFRQLAEANTNDAGNGRQFSVSFSVGIALVEPGDDLDTLLARADAALYVQKAARKARR
jgi:diguanylate cyclase (GGDEF)-like protein/PAS domain S-box-containing protein